MISIKFLKHLTTKIVVGVTLVCFSATSVFAQAPLGSLAKPAAPSADYLNLVSFSKNLNLPNTLGELDSIHIPSQKSLDKDVPFFIHIQDAHSHEFTQRQIKSILEHLKDQYGVKLFGYEGAHKTLDPSILSVLENSDLNIKVADYLLQKGLLTGAELFAFEASEKNKATDLHFEGIENLDLYKRDLYTFRKGLQNKESVNVILNNMDNKISRLKTRYYANELLKFDQRYQSFQNREHKNILNFFKEVKNMANEVLSLDLSEVKHQERYPQLVRISHLIDAEAKLNLKAIKNDIKQLSVVLSEKKADKNLSIQLSQLLKEEATENMLYPSWRAFFESLHHFLMKNNQEWTSFDNLRVYLKQRVLEEELLSIELFNELDLLVYAIQRNMSSNQDEEDLIHLEREFNLLKKLLNLTATRHDIDQINSKLKSLLVSMKEVIEALDRAYQWISTEDAIALKNQYALATGFYAGARDREVAFVDNLVELMKKQGESKVAFTAGGYHTLGIQQELKQRGFAYAAVSPNMVSGETLLTEKVASLYEEVMLNRQETIFDGNSNIVSELYLMGLTDFVNAGAQNRNRTNAWLEGFVKVSFKDLAIEVLRTSNTVINEQEIAGLLQKALRNNSELLTEADLQVSAVASTNGERGIRLTTQYNRKGRILSLGKLLETAFQAKETAEVVKEVNISEPVLAVAGNSLGERKPEGFDPGRRRVLKGLGGLVFGGWLGAIVQGCAKESSVVAPPLPNINLSSSAGVSSGATTNLALNQLRTPNAIVTGGSNVGTTVFGTGPNTIQWHFRHDSSTRPGPNGPINDFSGLSLTTDNFDDGGNASLKTPEDFIDLTQFGGSLVLNIKSLSGDLPQNLQIQFQDSNGTTTQVSFAVSGVSTTNATLTVDLNHPEFNGNQFVAALDKTKITTINITSAHETGDRSVKEGDVEIQIQGVQAPIQAQQVTAFAANATSDFSTQLRRPVVTEIPGGNAATRVQRIGSDRFIVNYVTQPDTTPGNLIDDRFSGAILFSNDFNDNNGQIPANIIPADFINGALPEVAPFQFNIQTTGTIPPGLKVVFQDVNGLRQDIVLQGLVATGSGGYSITTADFISPAFDPSQIAQIELVVAQPNDINGNALPQTMTGSFEVQVQGFVAGVPVAAAAPVANVTDFAALQQTPGASTTRRPSASRTAGSSTATTVFGETGTTFLWNMSTSSTALQTFSSATISADDFNDGGVAANKIPEDFMNFAGLTSLDFNLDIVSGEAPQNFTVTLTDRNGLKQDFNISGFDATNPNRSISIPLLVTNLPAGFDLTQVASIEFTSSQTPGDTTTHTGVVRVTTRGVLFTLSADAQAAAATTDFTSAIRAATPPREVRVTPLGGALSGTKVQKIAANRYRVNYRTSQGNFTGIQLSTDNNNGVQENPDFMDFSTLGGSQPILVRFTSGSNTIPNQVVLQLTDINGLPYRVQINSSSISQGGTQQTFPLDLSAALLPSGFDLTNVRLSSLVLSDDVDKIGTLEIDASGANASAQFSVGAQFADTTLFNFAATKTATATQPGRIRTVAGTSAGTSVATQVAANGNGVEVVRVVLATSTAEPNSAVEIVPELAAGTFFDLSSNPDLDLNTLLQSAVGISATNPAPAFGIRLTDSVGATVDLEGFFGVQGLTVGSTTFTNADSGAPAAVNMSQIASIQILAIHNGAAAAPITLTLDLSVRNVTAQSLGVHRFLPFLILGSLFLNGSPKELLNISTQTASSYLDLAAAQQVEVKYEDDGRLVIRTTTDASGKIIKREEFDVRYGSVEQIRVYKGGYLVQKTEYDSWGSNDIHHIYFDKTGKIIKKEVLVYEYQMLVETQLYEGTRLVQKTEYKYDLWGSNDIHHTYFDKTGKIIKKEVLVYDNQMLVETQLYEGTRLVKETRFSFSLDGSKTAWVYDVHDGAYNLISRKIVEGRSLGQRFAQDYTNIEAQSLGSARNTQSKALKEYARLRGIRVDEKRWKIGKGDLVENLDGDVDLWEGIGRIPDNHYLPASPLDLFLMAQPYEDIRMVDLTSRDPVEGKSLGNTTTVDEAPTTIVTVGTADTVTITQPNNSLILEASLALDGIAPTEQALFARFIGVDEKDVEFTREYVLTRIIALELNKEKLLRTPKAEIDEDLSAFSKAFPVFSQIRRGVGLEVEVLGNELPSESDMQGILANARLHPDLSIQLIYTGTDSETMDELVSRIQAKKDFSGKEIGQRFGVHQVRANRIQNFITNKLMGKVYKEIRSRGHQLANANALMNHTVFLGDKDVIEGLGYADSVRVFNNLKENNNPNYDFEITLVRVRSGRVAVKSYAGLAPEERAELQFQGKNLQALNMVAADLAAMASEWNAYVQSVLTSA